MIKLLVDGVSPDSEIYKKSDPGPGVEKTVSEILEAVRTEGDNALKKYTKELDRAELEVLEVSNEEIDAAMELVPKELIRVFNEAACNIRRFHSRQIRSSYVISESDGIVCGQRVVPIEYVGLYVPGGSAPLPSTVLMGAVPAKLAGCPNIIMCTPPSPDGSINPAILAAARIAGVDRIFKLGGAQAIAAMAYGTETVPRTDKIVGPGNAFVAEAKRQVYGTVSIDMIAGPSDILVVADAKSSPSHVAADLLSQAEHDKNASAVLVTDSRELAQAVSIKLEEMLNRLPRREIAAASIERNGRIILASSIKRAVEIANGIAPEHLELMVDNPFDYLGAVKNAGSVFMGRYCPEALGDYLSGSNHTLPTGGTARFSSPLSVDDFVKKTQYTYYTEEAFTGVYRDVAYFAKTESLDAHANSALIRFEEP